jgi:hypothetical protein
MPKNEVTVTIMFDEKLDFHQTFSMDTVKDAHFEYDGDIYVIPAQETGHYPPSFWDVGRRLAAFFELHKTLAMLFDWFQFRKRANLEIGFLYEKGKGDPIKIEDYWRSKAAEKGQAYREQDWGLYNYNLERNQTVEGHYRAVDQKLQGPRSPLTSGIIMALIAVVIVSIVVIVFVTSGHNPATSGTVQTVQNVTAPIHTAAPLAPTRTLVPTHNLVPTYTIAPRTPAPTPAPTVRLLP